MLSTITVSSLALVLVLVLPSVLAQSACSFDPDGSTPTGSGTCNCFESQDPQGWIVDCSRNSLTEVPAGLPAQTVYLSLNENSITTLTATSLQGLLSLETLQIQNNGLRSNLIEDDAFANLLNLKSLDLSSNRIVLSQAMIVHLLPLHSLETLTLTNNNINTIHSSALQLFDRLDTLDVTSNVFVCDCELSWFRNWLLNTGHTSQQIMGATCSSPQEFQRDLITVARFCPSSLCYSCSGGSDAECNSQANALQTCSSSQGACLNEIRVSNGAYTIQKNCKQLRACLNLVGQNTNTCNDGTVNSVCRTCCLGDLCNGPASGVLDGYMLPGFPSEPSLVVQTTTSLPTTMTETSTVLSTTESTKSTLIQTTMLPVKTSQTTPTIETTSSSRDTSTPQTQTLPENTSSVLQTTGTYSRETPTPISKTLTPLATRVLPTTQYFIETQTPSVGTTPVTLLPQTTTPNSQYTTSQGLMSEYVSTDHSPLVHTTQETTSEVHTTFIATTDSVTPSEPPSMSTQRSSTYPARETTAVPTTVLSTAVSPSATLPNLASSTEATSVLPTEPTTSETTAVPTTVLSTAVSPSATLPDLASSTEATSVLPTEPTTSETTAVPTTVLSTAVSPSATLPDLASSTEATDSTSSPTPPPTTTSARTTQTQAPATSFTTKATTSLPTLLSSTYQSGSPTSAASLPIETTPEVVFPTQPQTTLIVTSEELYTMQSSTPHTTSMSLSTQSATGTTRETTILATLLSSTTYSPSTTDTQKETTSSETSSIFYSDSTSKLHTTRIHMTSTLPSTILPQTSSINSVNSTTDSFNTKTTLGVSSRKPESSTSQYTSRTSTPTYRSTLINTDPPGTTLTPRTASVSSSEPSTEQSPPTSMTSSSPLPSTLSTKSLTSTESSSSVSTRGPPSTAQTSSSPLETTSPTSNSDSSTQEPVNGSTEAPSVTTTIGRPSTTNSPAPQCPEETTSDEYGVITWVSTPGRQTVVMRCPYGGSSNQQPATATRLCRIESGAVTWEEPDKSSCASSSQVLQRLSQVPITPDNAQTVSKNLTTITNFPMELNETDVDLAVDILENLARSINEYEGTEVVENALDAISNLAGAQMQTLVAGQQDADVATRVLHLIDAFALNVEFEGEMFDVVSERVDVVVVKINTDVIESVSFRTVVDDSGFITPRLSFNSSEPPSPTEPQASLELPGSVFEAHRGEIDRVQFVLYKDTVFFEVITEAAQNGTTPTVTTSIDNDVIERDALNSLVISASLGDLRVTGLRDPVKSSFVHQRPERAENPSCVFWDFNAAGGQGSWSTEGCFLSVTSEGITQCECDHLTNFALLMDIYGTTTSFNGDHMMALSIITFSGCILSIIGLIVTFFSYIMIRQLRSDRRTRVLLNLVVALTFMNVLFLTDAVITEFGHPGYVACKLIGALLHYGLLTSIAWMALEAWHMYLALVKVFDSYTSHLMKKMCVIGWGLPAVIVGVVIGIDLDHYEYYNEFCWVKVGGIPFYATFIAPALGVILFNFVIFALVTNQLCSLRRRSVSASSEQFDVSAQLRASLSITVLLGLTWGLGIFMIGGASLVFSYLFAIFNSFQGFSIFVFHCVLKEEVRLGWRKLFCPQCLTLEEMSKSSTGQNFSSSNKQAQLQKRMTIEYQIESNGRGNHQSQSIHRNSHEVPRFNPFAASSEFYQDSSI